MIWLKQMGMKPYSELDKIKIDNYTPQENPALETLKNGTNKPQFMNSNNTKPVIVFDVNETLLDMAPLKNNINSLLEEPQAFRIGLVWYCTILW
jgi:hypothetical protein